MREIKFRGKAIMTIEELERLDIPHDNGWIIGNLIQNGNRPMIVDDILEEIEGSIYPGWWAVVEPESVRQYTGLKDKKGTEIYEGDILKVEPENREHYPSDSLFWVNTNVSMWGLEFDWQHISGYECSTHIVEYDYDEYENVTQLKNVEVIGNIYENPELLEVKA